MILMLALTILVRLIVVVNTNRLTVMMVIYAPMILVMLPLDVSTVLLIVMILMLVLMIIAVMKDVNMK
jgi:hypothetical protein